MLMFIENTWSSVSHVKRDSTFCSVSPMLVHVLSHFYVPCIDPVSREDGHFVFSHVTHHSVIAPTCPCAWGSETHQKGLLGRQTGTRQDLTDLLQLFPLTTCPMSAAPERGSGPPRAVSSQKGTSATPPATALTSPTSPSSCRWSRWR